MASWKATAQDVSRQLDDALEREGGLLARLDRQLEWVGWLDDLHAAGINDAQINTTLELMVEMASIHLAVAAVNDYDRLRAIEAAARALIAVPAGDIAFTERAALRAALALV
jgi:hypothetical protein